MDSDGKYAFDEDDEEPETVDCMDDDSKESNDEFIELEMEPEPSTAKEQQEAEDFKYEVLTADQIVQFMVDCINEVNAVVQIPSTITRILLNYFKWDKEKLMERYYDGDQDSLFAKAHVISPYRRDQGRPAKRMTRSIESTSSDNTTCEICFDSRNTTEMSGLECGHKFCLECWCEYLTSKIIDEDMGQTISCAADDCDILVDDVTVMKLIHDPNAKLKYQQIITNSFVECNRLLRWCPAPDCGHAVKVAHYDTKPVTCKCGHTFCFCCAHLKSCGQNAWCHDLNGDKNVKNIEATWTKEIASIFACSENWHDPVKCVWLRKWIKKCDDDSETANTKECPKCHVTIEKDGGCNHMICKNQNCKADFCWVCLGPWEPHGSSWNNCNRYDEDAAEHARDAQEWSRAPQRYLFYCNRYMNHMQSLKLENKLYASVWIKMEEMQQHNMSSIEVQFLKKAVDVLCSCRQTLMYTYVFAFYLKKNNQSIIFEDNQKDLENATEQLSEYLERDISSEVLQDIKQKVQDKTRYCEERRNVLLEIVHEGYERDLWEYQEDL